ncbi:MAG TPA: SAM-dependent methyltransferase [Terriglobales bacterium]|nr:SAM-dependent methyltransferase [Terriglobales bacterium]
MSLRRVIEEEIGRHGPFPFSRYMELCLYHPELGYYSRPQEKFGKTGDFYTSSDVHAVFGRLLARQFEEMWRALGSPGRFDICELGPGRGLFGQDVLDWSRKRFPALYAALHCSLVENSPGLRSRLEERFSGEIAGGRVQVCASLAELHAPLTHAVVFANEFFDALPVEVVTSEGQVHVDVEDGRFVERFQPPPPEVHAFLDRYGVRPEAGERVEASLAAMQCVKAVAEKLVRGFVLLIDYGYTREEQLAGRHRDTLMTYRGHSAGENPYEAPGEQDITAHVNFTALRAAAEGAGLETLGLMTQAQFLMGIGQVNEFADAFEDCVLPQERAKVALQLKHLVTPAGMGETFQALVLARGVEKEKAARLSGLAFAR